MDENSYCSIDDILQSIPEQRNIADSKDKSSLIFGCIPVKWLNVILVVLTVVSNVSLTVSLPIYAGAMNKAGGDTFVVLLYTGMWFPIIFAFMTICLKYGLDKSISLRPTGNVKMIAAAAVLLSLNGVFLVYSSPPTRTAPYLQGVLSIMMIPYTIVGRYVILKKGME